MRPISLLKPVLVAVLGCVTLSGCGTPSTTAATTADRSPASSTVPATAPPDALSDHPDPETRFLAMMARVMRTCDPDVPGDKDGDGVPGPENLPGREDAPVPEYGPRETPPGIPNADGDIPVPLDDPAPPEPPEWPEPPASPSAPTRTGPVGEVPLVEGEECAGTEHAQRVGEAFGKTRVSSYRAMHEKLTGLDYPASRIHRMPDHAGTPRARLDLRMMGGRLVLEVTGAGSGVTVEMFGAPEMEDVKVTDVRRKPDAPTS